MTRYIVYRSLAGRGLGKEEDGEPYFVFVKEDDIKTGLVVPYGNPSLSPNPEGEVEARSLEEAQEKFQASRSVFYT